MLLIPVGHLSEVCAIIDGFAMPNAVAPTAAQQPLIDALFGHDSIEEIVTALAHHTSEFAQAALGTKIQVPTVDGEEEVEIIPSPSDRCAAASNWSTRILSHRSTHG